jgi:membrane-anchored glycerophosphoryl diester phosphodiesterase (GDPDase)
VTLVLALLYLVLVIFICVRMLMTSPVASEEEAGPVQILRRSWELTSGHWWRLFGFILIFFLGAGVVIAVVNWVISFIAVMLLGPVEPMSASALVVALVDACVNATVTVLLAVMLARIYLQLAGRESLAVGVPRSGI